jgi:hypothetical protein
LGIIFGYGELIDVAGNQFGMEKRNANRLNILPERKYFQVNIAPARM